VCERRGAQYLGVVETVRSRSGGGAPHVTPVIGKIRERRDVMNAGTDWPAPDFALSWTRTGTPPGISECNIIDRNAALIDSRTSTPNR
jgi:hypothetical protein